MALFPASQMILSLASCESPRLRVTPARSSMSWRFATCACTKSVPAVVSRSLASKVSMTRWCLPATRRTGRPPATGPRRPPADVAAARTRSRQRARTPLEAGRRLAVGRRAMARSTGGHRRPRSGLTMSSTAQSFTCCSSWVRVLAQVSGSGGCDIATAPKVSGELELR